MISYGVKDDPGNHTIRVCAFGVLHRHETEAEGGLGDEGRDGVCRVVKFQVWLDRSAVARNDFCEPGYHWRSGQTADL